MKKPLLIAHRGESRDAPENTLASVSLAWERGADAVEIDTRTSADGVAMVIHDSTTRRIGGPRLPVGRQTQEQLQALDAGSWKARRWRGERIPSLREVIASVPRQGVLFVELKEGPESVSPVLEVWTASGLPAHQVVFMSFNLATVAALARQGRTAPVCLLLGRGDWEKPSRLLRGLEFARAHTLTGVNLEVSPSLNSSVIGSLHEADLRVYCWTVNRVATARRLFAAGIDGVTTDRCAWMRQRLAVQTY